MFDNPAVVDVVTGVCLLVQLIAELRRLEQRLGSLEQLAEARRAYHRKTEEEIAAGLRAPKRPGPAAGVEEPSEANAERA